MAQRENGKNNREEYRRLQAQRQKRVRNQQMHEEFAEQEERYRRRQDTERGRKAAERIPGTRDRKSGNQKRKSAENTKKKQMIRNKRKAERASTYRGMALLILQLLASLLMLGMLFWLDMLPTSYIAAAAGVMFLLLVITLATQLASKGKKIVGKIFSVLITLLLLGASFFIYRSNLELNDITDSEVTMVVAVRSDDEAQELADTKDYQFGVQYAKGQNNIQTMVQEINKELGMHIETVGLDDLVHQARALVDGDVDAIIYNKVHENIMAQAVDGFKDGTRTIYEYQIEQKADDLTMAVEVQNEPFSVYISGIDVYGDLSQSSRSDVNIIAVVNPKSHQILLVTTPRDFLVEIPGVSNGQKDKLTHAGNYGVDVSMATLEELYDTDIPFYARLNFTSLINVVDILGGVEVDSEYTFTTGYESGKIVNIQKGMNRLNGEEALAFSRERKNVPGGDNQRGKNQQAVITGMIKKMLSPTMIVKANDIIDQVGGSVETNMASEQIRALIKQQLREKSDWHISSVAAEGTASSSTCFSSPNMELSVIIPNEDSVQNIIDLISRVENGEVLEDSVDAFGN